MKLVRQQTSEESSMVCVPNQRCITWKTKWPESWKHYSESWYIGTNEIFNKSTKPRCTSLPGLITRHIGIHLSENVVFSSHLLGHHTRATCKVQNILFCRFTTWLLDLSLFVRLLDAHLSKVTFMSLSVYLSVCLSTSICLLQHISGKKWRTEVMNASFESLSTSCWS